MSAASWDVSAEDFGQKVDLTVRIREILRNYPEGLSILKELIQNADDAGARTIRFCTAEQRHESHCDSDDALSNLMKGPSLLAYNSAKFTEVDFKSIQQIGDSLKKDAKGTKTGRFGVGVNSTYHLTDVPMFVSGTKVVMFDPQASFVPGINPANPGKMLDCTKENGRRLIGSLPQVFDPLKVFGCKLDGEDFNGTTFRFALRTVEQAKVSRLSRQSHSIEKMRDLLNQMASAASEMLLFLKNVECIEIYDWKVNNEFPTMIHRTSIANATESIRKRRSYVLNAPSRVPSKPVPVDYILDIQSTGIGVLENGGKAFASERWMVCNQLGGGRASMMANDPDLSHMKLIPWGGVAARLSPSHDVNFGNAYCFLPLPVQTQLPVHVNGYFELSSNRRDIWSGSDMAGDGQARAQWNESILQDIAAPSYIRLLTSAIRTNCVSSETYEFLFPQVSLSGPWKLLCSEFMKGIQNLPVLYSACTKPTNWVTPSTSILPDDDDDSVLLEIMALDRLPLVKLKSKELKTTLLTYGTCTKTSTPSTIRNYFATRESIQNGSLECQEQKHLYAAYLLSYCLKDLNPTQYDQLSGCQFIPLASGELGTFCILPKYDYNSVLQLQNMGFSKLLCIHSLRINNGDVDTSMEWLLKYRYEDEAITILPGIDPYLVVEADSASLLQVNASESIVKLSDIDDPGLKKFFLSGAASTRLNILPLQPDMLADVVARSIPRSWRGNDSAKWDPDVEWPNVQWFIDLWRFICSNNDIGESISTIAEQYCIVPTEQKLVCALSPGASVIDSNGLDPIICGILIRLGVRIFFSDVFPKDLLIPKGIWSYVYQPTADGVIKVIDAALRRENYNNPGSNQLIQADNEMKIQLFRYFSNAGFSDLSTPCQVMLRNFPIFPTYCGSDDLETRFDEMANKSWYILENATNDDATIMSSDFLIYSNRSEFELVKFLGAKVMNRMDFFKKVIVPQLETVSEVLRNDLIAAILLDLPSLASKNPGFSQLISGTRCIPSAVTKTLKCPNELYDPGVSQLVSLMDSDSFPDEFFLSPELLLSLRQLGMQSSLSWEVVLECARSIEAEGTQHNEECGRLAKGRGQELLVFLDMNKESYFPEMKKKSTQSRTGMLFQKMNAALFQDSEEIKRAKQKQEERVNELLNIKWMPVHTIPPSPFLPWPEYCEPVAAPLDTISIDKMWLASYSKRLVDGDVHSIGIKKMFGWLREVSVKDVSLQLRMLGTTFDELCKRIEEGEFTSDDTTEGAAPLTKNALCQKLSAEVGRIYHILNNIDVECDVDVMRSILHGSRWLWMGDSFVSSDHVAFTSSINAIPYLFTVPPDLACFKNLLTHFSVRNTFGSTDFCLVLNRMADEQRSKENHSKLSDKKVELAVNLVQKISDDILRLKDFDIYAPTTSGEMMLSRKLVYDDAPWLSKDLTGKKELIYAHNKLSASVCDRIGVQSVRKILLQSSTDMIEFGNNVVHEAFGQSESLTRRLKNIVEMYPEGPQQLSELIQNADDAGANVVKFLISKKHYGRSSLLGQKLTEWQGAGLYCYNDATFTARDFQNLAKIGQGSKLEKLVTTGRFGLGFNSVFHWTDIPSLVSGDYLVMFDPHAKYVPGATEAARGIKIRFSNTELAINFPDQMKPYFKFGCDMKNRFSGTLFRFPFRNDITAAASEISKKQYDDDETLQELISSFKLVISKVVLFLRHVKRVEVHVEDNDDNGPRLLYFAEVTGRTVVESIPDSRASGLESLRDMAVNSFGTSQKMNDWNAVANFISGPKSQAISKESFYSKLLRTPENQLPQTKHLVSVNFVDIDTSHDHDDNQAKNSIETIISDQYLICSALGAGKCRAMACKPEYIDLKFLPWAGIAAHIRRNGHDPPFLKGNAFCFLPLPAETGFPVHLNGYFELSANRRDIWFGDDMSGAGKVRSEWNRLLLSDVVAPLYTQLMLSARNILGPGKIYNQLWPVNASADIWKIVQSKVFEIAINLPLVYSHLDSGKWCTLSSAVFLSSTEIQDDNEVETQARGVSRQTLMTILLQEKISIVSIPPSVISCMNNEKCGIITVDPSMVREWFRKPINHPSIQDRENVIFLLKYCMDDLMENRQFHKLCGLPLLPLLNGLNGTIGHSDEGKCYFVPNETQKKLLDHAAFSLVDALTSDTILNNQLMSDDFHSATNVTTLDINNFVQLLSHAFPPEWQGLPEVRWIPNELSKDSSPENADWVSSLWNYIVSENERNEHNLSYFEDSLQIVPAVVGEGERTLQTLHSHMAVVDISETDNDEIQNLLWAIGIRTLDTSVFVDRARTCRALKSYIHPSTAKGIINALLHTSPDVSTKEKHERMSARFHYLSAPNKKKFRMFLRDYSGSDLSAEEIMTLRTLPIFEVFTMGQREEFSCLASNSYLPPSCAERNHLDRQFVKATSRSDVKFLEMLGISTMSPIQYYRSYLSEALANNQIEEKYKISAVTKMLQDIPQLVDEDGGSELLDCMTRTAFVPNNIGQLVRPCDLYDPLEPGLSDLVDNSMLPAKECQSAGILQTLRLMGMKTKLSSDGILESARRIEYEAKKLSTGEENEVKVLGLRRRATSLLNFLDDDETITTFLTEITEQMDTSVSHDVEGIELTNLENASTIIDELTSICWLPVERSPPINDHSRTGPPRREHQLASMGISSPDSTRPKADEWICSNSFDILSISLKSVMLLKMFQWNSPPNMNSLSNQIVALAKLSEEGNEYYQLRQHLPTVTSQIYEILDSQISSASDEEKLALSNIFTENPWIWVGDRFVSTNQVAFNAPDNAKPFLYTVPDAIKCYESLLQLTHVRQSFSGIDFAKLLSSLAKELQGAPCDTRQFDLAVFVSRYLSRVPAEELDVLDKSLIFLPSREKTMHRASEMTFDDAPWLSAIVKRTRHIFVHSDVGNEVARALGSSSLRDVLSANQNGMVKIPCPKHESLRQLLSKRDHDGKEMAKVILELIEIAEMKAAKQVSITFDHRSHNTMSLLHPCLAAAQGPALVICIHDVVMEVDELVKLTSPANYYASSISGNGSCGGSGFPRFGRGLCGSFLLSDCLQIISGRSLLIFDPNGEFFIEDQMAGEKNIDTNENNLNIQQLDIKTKKKKEKACARNYGISHSFCQQFPDQFEPFISLPYGISESMINSSSSNREASYRGVVIRIPFRCQDGPPSMICEKIYEESDIKEMISELKLMIPQSLLFTYNIQSINIERWSSKHPIQEHFLTCRVSSSPLSRRSHLEEMWENNQWKKDKSKLGQLFKSSWTPLKTHHILEVCSRLEEEKCDIVDTYMIMSILAPPRLREMACTDSLSPLNLLPLVSTAAHLNRNISTSDLNTSDYKAAEGTIFVGLPTGIETGLPFHINAPLFLHEWSGEVLLEKEDDDEFKIAFPGIRNVTIFDKQKTAQTRSLALYVWNRQAILSSLTHLFPSMINEIRNSIDLLLKDRKLLYRFWPYYDKICRRFRDLMDHSIYTQLGDMEIYLTETNGFKRVSEGCFSSPEYQLNDASDFFLQRMALFTTPKLVIEDLKRFGVDGRLFTPSMARNLLKGNQHVRELSGRPREVLAILEYCLADLTLYDEFSPTSKAASICRQELLGLYILPLSDGTIGKMGDKIIIANVEQQQLLPNRDKFLWPRAMRALEPFLSKSGFVESCMFEHFGPKILSRYISTALPKSWEGKDFVKWNGSDGTIGPTQQWIYQFWKEVSIWDHDALQLFRRWPLIPTKQGELASCGNARFILYLCTEAVNDIFRSSLSKALSDFQIKNKKEAQRDLMSLSAERRLQNSIFSSVSLNLEEFWEMGKVEDVNEALITGDEFEHTDNKNADNLIDDSTENIATISEEFHDVPHHESDEVQEDNFVDVQSMNVAQSYDPSSASFQKVYNILLVLQCPLLEASFFTDDDLEKILPTDRLGVSRSIVNTINQCTNYWVSNDSTNNSRLQWSSFSDEQFDELLMFLSSHQDNRLSLMVSDLTAMKQLPVFETFNGMHISLFDRDQNFTLNSNVDINSLKSYLPLSVQRKLLRDKPQFKDLYEDLNVRILDEASILQQFVLQEFSSLSITQKETVIKSILDKWNTLKQSEEFINILKDTPFVKKKENNGNGEVIFVTPNQLFDPRNELLNFVFDKDRSHFPAEEFDNNDALCKLVSVGLKTGVDKDTFLKCAWIIEGEQHIPKALKLFEYFNEHFAEFYDNNRGEFIRNLAEVCCVPTINDKVMGLCRFRDAAAPKDKNLVFKVMPIIHRAATPPQVMFSSLGIISPPPISIVLKQLRALIDDESILDQWNYQHSSIETVFSDIFSFLQENFDDLSPRVQDGLRDKAIVPVGTTLVKVNRLFFRLTKDLSPFFYEVPRAFGSCDVFLRNLGVREIPNPSDYAHSLRELHREIGTSKLNANELKSVIEVIGLAASNNNQNISGEIIFAPDHDGILVNIQDLLQNDQPWLVTSHRLDLTKVHLCHPKLNHELLKKLQIRSMSQHVHEVLDDTIHLTTVEDSDGVMKAMEQKIRSNEFNSVLLSLVSKTKHHLVTDTISKISFVRVEEINTRYILLTNTNGRDCGIDISNHTNHLSTFCFIDKDRMLVSKLPEGVRVELVVAMALCNKYCISREHIGGIAATLSVQTFNISQLQSKMGLYGDEFHGEYHRGEAGQPLVSADKKVAVVKPSKLFKQGEIVAVRSPIDSTELIYGIVSECISGNSLSRLSVSIGAKKEQTFLTSEVYTFGRSKRGISNKPSVEEVDISCLEINVSANGEGIEDYDAALIDNDDKKVKISPVKRSEILIAVQDLLQSADLSLNQDVKSMLASNLTLQESLSQKDHEMKALVKRTNEIAKKAMRSVDAFLCPITRDIMTDPVICSDGHTYERSAIELWFRNNSRSPKTNQQLTSKVLIPNHAMRSAIDTMTTLRESITTDWAEE